MGHFHFPVVASARPPMSEPSALTPLLSLPLVTETPAADDHRASEWHGWSPLVPPPAADAPEPHEPQGAYAAADLELQPPLVADDKGTRPVELLAPAGGPEAAFAAFHFGADAVYLGLKKFSACAEAENFTLDELAEVTAYAHCLQPRRRVFVTINTLIRQDELPELVDTLT